MVVRGLREIELVRDLSDVGLDGARSEHEPVGDGDVGPPLGHHRQHVTLTVVRRSRSRVVRGRRSS
jgi:hypothetical protein